MTNICCLLQMSLSVCRSGLRALEAYPLLGGGVTIPGQRLRRAIDSVPLFSFLYFLSKRWFRSPLIPPPIFTRVPFPTVYFCPYPLSSFLLPPLRPFMCSLPTASSSVWSPVVRLSEVSKPPADFK